LIGRSARWSRPREWRLGRTGSCLRTTAGARPNVPQRYLIVTLESVVASLRADPRRSRRDGAVEEWGQVNAFLSESRRGSVTAPSSAARSEPDRRRGRRRHARGAVGDDDDRRRRHRCRDHRRQDDGAAEAVTVPSWSCAHRNLGWCTPACRAG
jgi:hypothetical protein